MSFKFSRKLLGVLGSGTHGHFPHQDCEEKQGMSDHTGLCGVSESWRWESKAISGMGTASGEGIVLEVPWLSQVLETRLINRFPCLLGSVGS